MFFVQCFVWFVFSCVLMSFVEHQVHARIMHQRFFLSSKIPALEKVFRHHAGLHHSTYSVAFTDSPVAKGEDKGIRLSIPEGVAESLIFALFISLISKIGAVVFVLVVALHHMIWNLIHLEMHKPEGRFFSQWPVYKYLARHHLMHHKYPSKNMNVVFPFADFVLGTTVRPKYADIAKFYRAGLLPGQKSLPHLAKVSSGA